MTNQAERAPTTPEQKRFHPKRWLATAMACAALTACSDSVNNSFPKAPTTAETTAGPDDGEETASTEKPQIIPDEAKDWVAEYGDRYVDPVSTFYAELGYGEKYGKSAIISNQDISEYDSSDGFYGETSVLGFNMESLPLDAIIDKNVSLKIFNEWVAPNLNQYMNLIAKNPTPEGLTMIESEFLAYCEGIHPSDITRETYDPESMTQTRKILGTIEAIVAKYGSSANYSITPAVSWEDAKRDRPNTIFFNETYVYDNGSGFSDNGIRLLINVDTYNDKEVSRTVEIIEGFQLNVDRQPLTGSSNTFSYLSFGQA